MYICQQGTSFWGITVHGNHSLYFLMNKFSCQQLCQQVSHRLCCQFPNPNNFLQRFSFCNRSHKSGWMKMGVKWTDNVNREAEKVIYSSRQALEDFKSDISASQEHLIPPIVEVSCEWWSVSTGHDNSRSNFKEIISYTNKVHYKNLKMTLLQCNPFVVLNRLRRGNTKARLPMKSSGILVLDLNQRKCLPNILVFSCPKKYIFLLPKKELLHIWSTTVLSRRAKKNAEEPNSKLSRAWQGCLL